jgi:hypothetical protein
MGVSLPNLGGEVDFVKLALFLGDEYVLQEFGRAGNTYCRSAMSKIRDRVGSDTGRAVSDAMELMRHNLIELAQRSIAHNSGFGKYTSINPKDKYIEFRSAGGPGYFRDIDRLKNTLLRYAQAMTIAGNPASYRREYYKKLYKLISPKENDPALALFAQFASGELSANDLKSQWAELALIKERPKPGEEREWEAVDPDTGAVLGTVQDASMTNATNYFRDTLKLNGFQVREKEPELKSARAKLAKRIKTPKQKDDDQDSEQLQARIDPAVAQVRRDWEFYRAETGAVIDRVTDINMIQANAVRADIVRRYGHPDDSVRMRSVPTEQSAERARARIAALGNITNTDVLDVEPNVAQNFAEPQATLPFGINVQDLEPQSQQMTVAGAPSWEIYNNDTNQVVRTFFQRNYQDAMVYAGQWLIDNGFGLDEYGLRPTMETQ